MFNNNFMEKEPIREPHKGASTMCYVIKERWAIYQDGTIYDTDKAKDIPQWIFELRDFILENYKEMKGQTC